MDIIVFITWLVIWVVFLLMSTIEKKGPVFGFLAGFWILFLGIYVYLSGIQYESGMSIATVGDTTTVTYLYSDFVYPVSDYGILWGIPFIALSIYIFFISAKRRKGTEAQKG